MEYKRNRFVPFLGDTNRDPQHESRPLKSIESFSPEARQLYEMVMRGAQRAAEREAQKKAQRMEEETSSITQVSVADKATVKVPKHSHSKISDPIKKQEITVCVFSSTEAPLKDIQVSLEHPLFSLSKIPDTKIRYYENGENSIKVVPSVMGIATMWDKEILLFVASKLVDTQNQGRHICKKVRFNARELLQFCGRDVGGKDYKMLECALMRLRGTSIETNIKTNGHRQIQGFGLIENYGIIKDDEDKRMRSLEITLSDWLYNAILASEVLTLSPEYFKLSKALERRVYEIGRKHCGNQKEFKISLEILKKKIGSTASLKKFRLLLREIVSVNKLPEYIIDLDCDGKTVYFRRRQAS